MSNYLKKYPFVDGEPSDCIVAILTFQ